MTQSFDFTEEKIRRKLEELGYSHIPADKLKQFQRGLLQVLACWELSFIPQGVHKSCEKEIN